MSTVGAIHQAEAPLVFRELPDDPLKPQDKLLIIAYVDVERVQPVGTAPLLFKSQLTSVPAKVRPVLL